MIRLRVVSAIVLLTSFLGTTLRAAEPKDDPLPAGAIARLGTTRLRPGGRVEFLAFSPDGKRLASWSEVVYGSCDCSTWDVATGRELRRVVVPSSWTARSFSWLPDGRGAAVVPLDGFDSAGFFVWDFATEDAPTPPIVMNRGGGPRMIPALPPDQDADSCFDTSRDGKLMAVGRAGNQNRERPIELREFNPGRRSDAMKSVRRLGLHPENCAAVRFTPDGRTLVSFGKIPYDPKPPNEVSVVVWDVAGEKDRRRLTVPAPIIQGYRPSLAVSNQYLALGLKDEVGTLRLFDLATGQDRTIATGHKSARIGSLNGVSATAFTPDGQTLITAGRDSVVKIWDVASGNERHALTGHASFVEALAVSPDGKTLASAGQDGVIRLWNLETGADVCPQPGHASFLHGVSVSLDGRTAITASLDGTMRTWDMATAKEVRTIKASCFVSRGELSPERRMIVAGAHDQPLQFWEADTGKETRPAGMSADAKARIAQFIDARTLMTIHEGNVTLWNWPAATVRQSFVLPPPAKQPGSTNCSAAMLSPDGRLLVTVAYRLWNRAAVSDGVIDLWDATSGKRIRRLIQSPMVLWNALFTSNGELIVQGGGTLLNADGGAERELRGNLNLIDPLTSKVLRSFGPLPTNPVVTFRDIAALTLSSDGRSLFVADGAGAIAVCEVATGRVRHEMTGHRSYISGLAITRDGKRLLTASHDATALVWDLSPAAAFPRPAQPPTADQLAKHWSDLAEGDAAVAFRAMASLAAYPTEGTAMLASLIKPVAAGPDAATLDKWVSELGNEKFAVRDKASAELDKLGEAAVPGLRERLANVTSAEARKRIIRLLEAHDPAEASPQRLQTQRALELLEGLGTPEARALLTKLAAGVPEARLTREAKQCLERLGGKE